MKKHVLLYIVQFRLSDAQHYLYYFVYILWDGKYVSYTWKELYVNFILFFISFYFFHLWLMAWKKGLNGHTTHFHVTWRKKFLGFFLCNERRISVATGKCGFNFRNTSTFKKPQWYFLLVKFLHFPKIYSQKCSVKKK